jgi:Lar family restriction alleviation protein
VSDDLLPCPFCGEQAEVIECDEPSNEGGLAVQCMGCNASSRVHFSCKEDARPHVVSAWNARAREAAHDKMVEALREIETICTESAGDCRKRMGTRVGNALVTARAALAIATGEQT